MTSRRKAQVGGAILGVALLAWSASLVLERVFAPSLDAPGDAAPPAPEHTAHITATLFYGSEDGQALVAVRREVPLADGVTAQGEAILRAALDSPPEPYRSVIPAGTTLRGFYVTGRGDAFVDMSGELMREHRGGSFSEMLTVYAIVNAVTSNLPAVQRVQILVDGREVDSIAGHVDARRPLSPDLSLVRGGAAGDEGTPDARR